MKSFVEDRRVYQIFTENDEYLGKEFNMAYRNFFEIIEDFDSSYRILDLIRQDKVKTLQELYQFTETHMNIKRHDFALVKRIVEILKEDYSELKDKYNGIFEKEIISLKKRQKELLGPSSTSSSSSLPATTCVIDHATYVAQGTSYLNQMD